MNSKSYLTAVGSTDAKPSAPEEMLRDFVKGILSKESYETLTVLWVADHADKYRPEAIPEPDSSSRSYVSDRLNRHCAYHYDSAKLLGEWFALFQQFLDRRTSDLALLVWALEKCAKHPDLDPKAKISRVLALYHVDRVDQDFVEKTIRVKKLDADERERAKRY